MSSKGPRETRRNTRAPVTVEVSYRTAGSFLVSYSLNLSRGGLFLETDARYLVGTNLVVRFSVPQLDDPIETQAQVVWRRTKPTTKGPAGCGLSFDQLDDQIGERIDEVVRGFSGVTMLVVASDAASERLARSLCNVITSTVQRTSTQLEAIERMSKPLELVVVDMESIDSDDCLAIFEAALKMDNPVPIIAVVKNDRQVAVAAAAGVTLALDSPVRHEDLRNGVLTLLSKPARTS